MRNLQHIEKHAKKLEKFNLNNIADSIFRNTPPSVKIIPFSSLKDTYLNRNSYNVLLYIFDGSDRLIPSLSKALEGTYEENVEAFYKLPSWIVGLLHTAYKKEVENWIDFLFDHISEFCEKDSESLINWNVVDKGGIASLFSDKLTFEQRLWISVQSKISKEEMIKFVNDIRDSLLPWLNTDLYQKVQDRKDNTRENTAYEAQRKKLQEGKLEDLDIIR